MSPRTKEQWEPIKARRRAHILEAALRLFATRGVELTSMEEIARRSGVSKGLVYAYFRNKDALLGAVIDAGVQSLERLIPGDAASQADPRKAVETMVQSSFRMMRSQKKFWSLYLSLITHPGVIKRHRSALVHAAEEFRLATARGFGGTANPKADLAALTLMATLDGMMLHYLLVGELYPLDDLRDYILREWLNESEEA